MLAINQYICPVYSLRNWTNYLFHPYYYYSFDNDQLRISQLISNQFRLF